MNEVVIISGKGGTGKTSLAASLAALAGDVVLADCDVDASNLPIVLFPQIEHRQQFRSGHEAIIRPDDCIGCGVCLTECRFRAVQETRLNSHEYAYSIDPLSCEGCGVCVHFCPKQAIDFPERLCGEWLISETRLGPMVHARMAIAAENSGKLVTVVRAEARKIAEQRRSRWMIVDGPPGIGCPVIASVTGASIVLIVTEPTLSAAHDLERVIGLTNHFRIPAMVCINKWELNARLSDQIEQGAKSLGASIAGKICYDHLVTKAQVKGKTVIESGGPAAEDIRKIWQCIEKRAHGNDFPAGMGI